uniref:ATPase, T2SS/T4P/T4SS family n=1 Tax=Armatimonas sp. TaxID=1872638 RepID=UPI003752369E
LRIRFRVGGVLKEVMHVPKLVQNHFVRRVMVMADIDLARLFVPQVGTIRLQHNRKDYNLRVTAIPTLYGHTVTARLLSDDLPRKGLQALGMLAEHQVPLETLLTSAGGLFLFVGPSASGTTTTAATCLHYLNEIERAIYTIEQPIEYELPGVTQIQLNPFCGHTLDKALKTVLRARPDVLFLGSIHDAESARAAVEAAEAGITVLTTMRCTNIPTVFTLLERYGVAPQVQARLVQVIVNQCLARSENSETQQAFYEAAWVADNTSLRELVEKRATHQEIRNILRYWSKGTTLEEQLVNPRPRADS